MGAAQKIAFRTDNDIFNYLDSVSSVAALDPKERYYYDAALRYSRDYHAVLETAKEKAEAEGRAEGEKSASKRIAKEMLLKGLPEEMISQLTHLSLEEIRELL